MPKMRTSFQGLVQLLARSLYPEPEVFIRELLQNAHDSIQLRRVQEPQLAGEIGVNADPQTRTLSFSDNGAGMDRRDIEEFLSTIGSTGTGTQARRLGKEVHYFPADMNHQRAIEKAKKQTLHSSTDFGGEAGKTF